MTQSSRHGQIHSERRQQKGSNSRTVSNTVKVPNGGSSYWYDPVIDDSTATPPGSPTRGDRYVVPCGATGAWVGHVGDIAEWNGVAWVFTTPRPGATVLVGSRNYFTTFLAIPQLAGPAAADDITAWVPAHLIDASHTQWNYPVLDILNTPPGSPSIYDAYLVDNTPTGAWVGYTNHIAVYVCDTITAAGAWVFLEPTDGRLVWVIDEDTFYVYNGDDYVPLEDTLTIYFDDLADVAVPTPANGDLVQYSNGTSMWENITVADLAGQIFLGQLADVDDTAATNGQWLRKISDTGAANDYQFDSITSDDVGNDSNVPGATVTDALNNIDSDITNIDGRVTTLEGAGPASYALDDLTDVSTGSPGAGQDGYVVAWDNGSSMYTLQAPSGGGGGGGGGTVIAGQITFGSGGGYTIDSGTGFTVSYPGGTATVTLSTAFSVMGVAILTPLASANVNGAAGSDPVFIAAGTSSYSFFISGHDGMTYYLVAVGV